MGYRKIWFSLALAASRLLQSTVLIMKTTYRSILRTGGFAALFLVHIISIEVTSAQTYREKGDAGTIFETAPVIPPGVQRIIGTLKPGLNATGGANPVDIDVYLFSATLAMGEWEIRVRSTPELPSPVLYISEGFFGYSVVPFAPPGQDVVYRFNSQNSTTAVAVANNPLVPFGVEDPLFPHSRVSGVRTVDPVVPTTGQSYTIEFNFKTDVTGINLTVGERYKPSSQKGRFILNDTGKDQTVTIRGRDKARIKVSSQLYFWETPIAYDIVLPPTLALRRVWNSVEGENVTAEFRAGRYNSPVTVLNGDSMIFVVESPPKRGATRVSRPESGVSKGKVRIRGFRADDRKQGDTVAAEVILRDNP